MNPKNTLREGDDGNEVTWLQKRLQTLELLDPRVNIYGHFGYQTKAAVIKFQKSKNLTADGIVGAMTWAAILGEPELSGGLQRAPNVILRPTAPVRGMAMADERSEKIIATLHPLIRDKARQFVRDCADQGVTIKLISGLRTYAEQDDLYAQGRSKPGNRVTNAKAGFSNHNFGLAFDIGIFVGGQYVPESSSYRKVSTLGKALGFEWGGDWTSIKDEPHYQVRPDWAKGMKESVMLAELRRRKDAGIDFLA